jgi:plasmid stabilization system protein ParE
MPRGDKSAYSEKQKRQAEHIEESAKERGYSQDRAEQIAWATVNKQSGGGIKSGHGHEPTNAAKRATAKSAAKSRETGTTSVERGEAKSARAGSSSHHSGRA